MVHMEIEREVRQYKLSSDLLESNELYYDFQFVKNNEYLLKEPSSSFTSLNTIIIILGLKTFNK